MKKRKDTLSTEEKIDKVLMHLENLDKRDKLRTWGGAFRGFIGILPTLAFIIGAWYLYKHGDEILAKIASEAAKQAAEVTKQGTEGIWQQIQGSFQVN